MHSETAEDEVLTAGSEPRAQLAASPIVLVLLSLLVACGEERGGILLEVGDGTSVFCPLASGDSLPVWEGLQGGRHVWIGIRTRNAESPVEAIVELLSTVPGQPPLCSSRYSELTLFTTDSWQQVAGLLCVIEEAAPLPLRAGRLHAVVVDGAGNQAEASVDVVLRAEDPGEPSGCSRGAAGVGEPVTTGGGPMIGDTSAGFGDRNPAFDDRDHPALEPDDGSRIGGRRVEPRADGRWTIERSFDRWDRVALGDCDDDGRPDLFYAHRGTVRPQLPDGSFGDPYAVFPPVEPPGPAEGGQAAENHKTVVVGDIDGDGFLDAVAGRDSLLLARGQGGCRFSEPERIATACGGGRVPAQVTLGDIDRDGLIDIAVSCSGVDDPHFRYMLARGDGAYVGLDPPWEPLAPTEYGLDTFAIYFDDIDGDGWNDVMFLSEPPPFDDPAIRALFVQDRTGWFGWGLRSNAPTYETDLELTAHLADVNAMAVATLDADRDGSIDYFISGANQNRLLQNRGGRSLVNIAPRSDVLGVSPISYWAAYAADFDLDGWSDVLVLGTDTSQTPQVPVVPDIYLNRHDGTFVEAGDRVLGDIDGFETLIFACGDITRSGRVECLIPSGSELHRLTNEMVPRGGWIGVELTGTVSAPNAAGARVGLDGEVPPLEVVTGGLGTPRGLHHDGAVLLAVGDRTQVDIRVTWPSGLEQRVEGLATGEYHRITEPEFLLVSERVGPADGRGEVMVEVELGVAGAETATIEVAGAGTWSGPVTREGATLRRVLVAPGIPGAARIEVELDGAPIHVRPRVIFD